MDLSVKPEDVTRILKDVRELIKDNILVRLTDLEEEVRLLRKVTWPICQGLSEKSQLSDIEAKREFLKYLRPEEVEMLLKLKSKGNLHEEFRLIHQQSDT